MISVTCNYCGSDDFKIRYGEVVGNAGQMAAMAFRCTSEGYGSHAQIVQCRFCGHVYANPRWSADELIDAYTAVEDETYILEQYGRKKTFAHHLNSLEEYTGPANGRPLLDIGAYIGIFVDVALEAGWQAIGVEPSRWAVDIAQEAGLPVLEGTLNAELLKGRHFDVITMWDVIEHVDDPLAELNRAYELLNPGGIIAVHTMDISSPVARLMGKRWPWFMDMHIHYFSRQSLASFLEKVGFETLWIGAQGRYLSLGYLVSRVTALSQPLGQFFGGMVSRTGRQRTTVPINFGDLITAYARKPTEQ